jgi:hypothetical protein
MTNKQIYNLGKLVSFSNNVGKLSIGRSTKLTAFTEDGNEHVLAKVTCDTVGQLPRTFTVSSASGFLPSGKGYTYKKIMNNLFINVTQP